MRQWTTVIRNNIDQSIKSEVSFLEPILTFQELQMSGDDDNVRWLIEIH